MRLINADALEAEIHAALRDADDINGAYILNTLDAQKTVDAVPIKAISAWLAAYAAPPKYALDHFPESGHCLANTRAAAWEHHIRTMVECGLLQEDNHGETGDM